MILNKPGGQNIIGAQVAARSAPDGYTFYFATTAALVSNVYLFKQLPYDPVKDFDPVAFVATSPFGIMVPGTSPVRSIAEFIAASKAAPDRLSLAHEGPRTLGGMAARLLNARAGIRNNLVPYASASVGIQDALGGRVDAIIVDLASTTQHIKHGDLRLLATTSARQLKAWEATPALSETLPGFDMPGWFAVVAPAGTPKAVVVRVNRDINAALAAPELVEKISAIGPIVDPGKSPSRRPISCATNTSNGARSPMRSASCRSERAEGSAVDGFIESTVEAGRLGLARLAVSSTRVAGAANPAAPAPIARPTRAAKPAGQRRSFSAACTAPFLVQEIDAVQGEQRLAEAGDGTETAARDIGQIVLPTAVGGVFQREVGFPQEGTDKRLAQHRRIGLAAPLQAGEHLLRVPQHPAERHLAHVDRRDEGIRMAGLVDPLDPAGVAGLDHASDLAEVAVERINPLAPDRQPGAAVDPSPPLPDRRDRSGGRPWQQHCNLGQSLMPIGSSGS